MIRLRLIIMAILVWIAIGALGLVLLMRGGMSVRKTPGRFETFMAVRLRNAAIPVRMRKLQNPLAANPEAWRDGFEHFAEHCAFCHDQDGRGRSYVARHLDPPSPDLSQPRTQRLSDGALYAIITNGVRWTGMPAWGEEHRPEDTWNVVSYIRKLPSMPSPPVREKQETDADASHRDHPHEH